MKSHVLTPLHHLRRVLDTALSSLLPPPTPYQTRLLLASSPHPFPTRTVRRWTSLYHMVTFRPDVGYAEALRREAWQKTLVRRGAIGFGATLLAGVGWASYAAWILYGGRAKRTWWKFW